MRYMFLIQPMHIMKQVTRSFLYLFIIFSFTVFSISSCNAAGDFPKEITSVSDTLRVATYNIRLQTTADKDNRAWTNRKKDVAQLIYQNSFDIFGVQEIGSMAQENDLKTLLPAYDFVSKGRDDSQGKTGERLGIFFNKKRFSMEMSGFFFLSETPSVAGKGWDAALNRICLWAMMKDLVTNTEFFVFNVHFDHLGVTARAKSAELVVSKMNALAGNLPVIVLGDMNANLSETAVHSTFTTAMSDSRIISQQPSTGPTGTFNNWAVTADNVNASERIDYIYVKNIRVCTYSVLTDRFTDSNFPSDHFPVMIRCWLWN